MFGRLNKIDCFDILLETVADLLKEISFFQVIHKREIVFSSKTDFIDSNAKSILAKSNSCLFELTPILIKGDGNCFYRSVSKALYGKEDYHYEVRFRTLVEMVLRKDEFLDYASKNKFGNIDFFHNLAPGEDGMDPLTVFKHQSLECSKLSGWATIWHIFAAAQAFSIDIYQVYPSTNASKTNSMVQFLNKPIRCLNERNQGKLNKQ